jgi:hypothetical protein
MNSLFPLRSLFLGVLSSFVSALIMVGAILVALAEGLVVAPVAQAPTEFIPVIEVTIEPGQPTAFPPTLGPSRTVPVAFNITATPILVPGCARPAGWVPYTFQIGDSAAGLAASRGITLQELLDRNCLISARILQQGNIINLPPILPSATWTIVPSLTPSLVPTLSLTPFLTSTRCGPPAGWVLYRVKPGDNLYSLSALYQVSIQDLQAANCLTGTIIHAGSYLYVPKIFTRTPSLTLTSVPSLTPSPTRTRTSTSPVPSLTRTPTPTPVPTTLPPSETPTGTSTATPTATSTSTAAPTATSTSTAAPTATSTSTAAPTATSTPTLPATETATPTVDPTATSTETATPLVPPAPGG